MTSANVVHPICMFKAHRRISVCHMPIRDSKVADCACQDEYCSCVDGGDDDDTGVDDDSLAAAATDSGFTLE